MSFEIAVSTKFTRGSTSIGGMSTISAGSILEIDEPFGDSLILNETIDASALKAILVVADCDALLEFSGESDPQFLAVNLLANEPFVWHERSGLASPFGIIDVTSIAFSASAGSHRAQIQIVTDPTP